ncbi:MAG TPA: hypothetical protein DCE41_22065 [Cytophagales bacterium]|nr:hypothetical protein [Cytophagales bacterium]HAA24402.1 hypothetical protein [Cytophagales bacterium]HAP59694.1 hypothetical protein [Cytophagales bacterium]
MDNTSFIEKATKQITNLDPNISFRYVQALKDSLSIDLEWQEGSAPKCSNGRELAERYGIGIDSLTRYGVLLDMNNSVDFLATMGVNLTMPQFRGKYNKNHLKEFFDKEIVTSLPRGKGRLVFTYAQLLHLTETLVKLKIPTKLQKLLDERNK